MANNIEPETTPKCFTPSKVPGFCAKALAENPIAACNIVYRCYKWGLNFLGPFHPGVDTIPGATVRETNFTGTVVNHRSF